MENRELKVEVPIGYEIDKENSTFECIKFKKKGLFILDEIKQLIKKPYDENVFISCLDRHEQQLRNYLDLLIVADYVNEGWEPDLYGDKTYIGRLVNYIRFDGQNFKNSLFRDEEKDGFFIFNNNRSSSGEVPFKNKEAALKAIDILGKENIEALCCMQKVSNNTLCCGKGFINCPLKYINKLTYYYQLLIVAEKVNNGWIPDYNTYFDERIDRIQYNCKLGYPLCYIDDKSLFHGICSYEIQSHITGGIYFKDKDTIVNTYGKLNPEVVKALQCGFEC